MRPTRAFHLFVALMAVVLIVDSSVVRAGTFGGYTLFAPNNSKSTRLLDSSKTAVHTWSHSRTGGYAVYLLDNTDILRTASAGMQYLGGGGAAGVVQEVDWAGNLVWEYTYSSTTYLSHHDIEPMPNGNVLLIAWEVKTAAQAEQAGLNRSVIMWPDHIIEVQPTGATSGAIVWEWHAWDHLIQDHDASKDNYGVVADHPELLDINTGSGDVPSGGGDWMHINGISYDPVHDQIVISSHNLDEIYVIDHSTTTAEAATHTGGNSGMGGDILYRWGNPSNYDMSGTHYFYVCHNSNWIPEGYPGAGNILTFNNREGYSTSIVAEITPPRDSLGNYTRTAGTAFGPSAPTWTYTATGFFTNHLGSCQRLLNGNTLIVESTSGIIFEVDSVGTIVWTYTYGSEISRALRYAANHPGLDSLDTGANEAPVVSDIPDQTIIVGGSFTTISLDNYVADADNTDAEMTWTYSGNANLVISIVDRVATITPSSAEWIGSETITFRATDPGALYDEDAATFTVRAADDYVCGDANGDKKINVGDAVFVITYIFRGGTTPDPVEAADANCDNKVNVGDAVYIITYIFRGGAGPCCP